MILDAFKRGTTANYQADGKFNTDENKMASFEAMFRGSGKQLKKKSIIQHYSKIKVENNIIIIVVVWIRLSK